MHHHLKYLDLTYNRLPTFPAYLLKFTNITFLTISSNQLKEIPEGISAMSQLEYLSVGNNKIEKVPSSLRELTKLHSFKVSSNALIEFPSEIWSHWKMLKSLEMENNKLASFSLDALKGLQLAVLCCVGNPFVQSWDATALHQLDHISFIDIRDFK
uniref:Uncharacterized protein n=1 Tax=Arcella intermedia TaxID=1963864 RepID=A0A6B2LNY4_9EUKA